MTIKQPRLCHISELLFDFMRNLPWLGDTRRERPIAAYDRATELRSTQQQ